MTCHRRRSRRRDAILHGGGISVGVGVVDGLDGGMPEFPDLSGGVEAWRGRGDRRDSFRCEHRRRGESTKTDLQPVAVPPEDQVRHFEFRKSCRDQCKQNLDSCASTRGLMNSTRELINSNG